MRIDGTLKKWNDERCFGFIVSNQGGQEIFVHVSSFGRIDRRPQLGEPLSFEIELDREGRKRAINILRPARADSARAGRRKAVGSRSQPSLVGRMIMLAIIVALGAYAYTEYARRSSTPVPTNARQTSKNAILQSEQDSSAGFQCDGRTHCSQMNSCAEATFFLKNCPGVKMDGDGDGMPCEEQWCTSFFAR